MFEVVMEKDPGCQSSPRFVIKFSSHSVASIFVWICVFARFIFKIFVFIVRNMCGTT